MFFVAFFGIQDKEQYIGTCNNIACFSCGRLAGYEIYKTYRYFHIFLIPIFRWNVKYIVKASCCGSLYELDSLVGKEFEKNSGTEIRRENLRRINDYIPFRRCSNCKADLPVGFDYCPYCGGKL